MASRNHCIAPMFDGFSRSSTYPKTMLEASGSHFKIFQGLQDLCAICRLSSHQEGILERGELECLTESAFTHDVLCRMSLLYSSFKCLIMFDRLFSFLFQSYIYIIYICPILSNYPSTYPGDTQEASPIAFVCLSFVPDLSLNFRNSTQG
jgi:hypothetical protein